MTGNLLTVLTYVLIPVAITIAGGVMAAYRKPGEKTRVTVQHFAAGVVFAAVALELLPEITRRIHIIPLVIGFCAGVSLMLVVRKFSEKLGGVQGTTGLIVAAAVDVFIDGLLMGVSFDVGLKEGIIITAALSIELLFLALAVSATMTDRGVSTNKIVVVIIMLSILVLFGALLGATLLSGLGGFSLDLVIAFAVAALLYLVTEELLVEAHRGPSDSAFSTTMFFVGFLIVIILEAAAV